MTPKSIIQSKTYLAIEFVRFGVKKKLNDQFLFLCQTCFLTNISGIFWNIVLFYYFSKAEHEVNVENYKIPPEVIEGSMWCPNAVTFHSEIYERIAMMIDLIRIDQLLSPCQASARLQWIMGCIGAQMLSERAWCPSGACHSALITCLNIGSKWLQSCLLFTPAKCLNVENFALSWFDTFLIGISYGIINA